MSWIKKLFQKFKNEDEDYEYIEETVDYESESYRPNRKQPDTHKDIDAKVLYQYPKGKFRFPLIPDTPEEKVVTREEPYKNKRNEQVRPIHTPRVQMPRQQESLSKRNKQETRQVQKPKMEAPPASVNSTVKKEARPNFSKRPFRPTEIPSPIYGYGRPKKVDEIVEVELDGLGISPEEKTNNAKLTQSNRNSVNEVAVTTSEYEELAAFEEAQTEPISANILNHLSEQAQVVEEFVEVSDLPISEKSDNEVINIEEKQIIQLSDDITVESRRENLEGDLSISGKHVEYQVEELRMDDQDIQTQAEVSAIVKEKNIQSKDEVLVDIELNNEVLVESIDIANQTLNAESQTNWTNQEQAHEQYALSNSQMVEEESNIDIARIKENEESIIVNEYDTESEQTEFKEEDISQSVSEEKEVESVQPKRSHLPFNVLMLKQDKRHLEQSSRFARDLNQPNSLAKPFAQSEDQKPVHETSADKRVKVEPEVKEQKQVLEGSYGQQNDSESDRVNRPNVVIQEESNHGLEPNSLEQSYESNDETVTEDYQIQNYVFPQFDLLQPPVIVESNSEWMMEQEHLLNETLKNFNVGAKVVNVTQGPSVTRFEIQPEPGVKVNKITNLSDDIKLSLAAKDIRMEAPIPGKHTIGIEVPNATSRPVLISEIINSPEFLDSESPLTAILGLDIAGKPIVTDLRKMPHGLIAGATGSGKSVCINTILVSLLYKANPDELKLLLIDPKMVELAPYNFIPHLVSPVITDVKAATAALKWAVEEMERRYELFAHTGVRDISRFNQIAEEHKRYSDKLPYIVIVIDELADLMMMSPADVEEAICRIAQKARACGIHLIIATQRPSVDVITGLIKANVPTRIAFSVSSQVDSRTIIDISGAERLLGRGDMLFLENGSSKPVRLQGTFVSDLEIDEVVAHVRKERKPEYLFEQEELLKKAQISEEEDELFYEACEFVIDQGGASTSSLQRRFKIGYNRAARLIDMMEKQGFISEARGSKPRDVLITEEDLESILVQ